VSCRCATRSRRREREIGDAPKLSGGVRDRAADAGASIRTFGRLTSDHGAHTHHAILHRRISPTKAETSASRLCASCHTLIDHHRFGAGGQVHRHIPEQGALQESGSTASIATSRVSVLPPWKQRQEERPIVRVLRRGNRPGVARTIRGANSSCSGGLARYHDELDVSAEARELTAGAGPHQCSSCKHERRAYRSIAPQMRSGFVSRRA